MRLFAREGGCAPHQEAGVIWSPAWANQPCESRFRNSGPALQVAVLPAGHRPWLCLRNFSSGNDPKRKDSDASTHQSPSGGFLQSIL